MIISKPIYPSQQITKNQEKDPSIKKTQLISIPPPPPPPEMPFNAVLVAAAANFSGRVWQQVACLPERVSSDELLDLVICFPLQQLGRLVLRIWTYLCVSPHPNDHYYYAATSDDDSDGGGGGGGGFSSGYSD